MEENMSNNNVAELKAKIKEKLKQVKKLTVERKDTTSLINEIWNLSKQKFIINTKLKKSLKKYEGLIFTIGFSPEPIILSILGVKPQCVYLIYTKESENIIDRIVHETNLKPSQFKREILQKVSAADSYRLVKEGVRFLTEEKGITPNKIALDPTGGTKIMSVGCGIAASVFNLDILYVNNQKYDPELRIPEPGSEILINIPNPFDFYQDNKILEGLNYLKNFKFSNAKTIFYAIKQSSTNPLFAELLANISEVLYCWDMIDYFGALNCIEKAFKDIDRLKSEIRLIKGELLDILQSWEEYLQVITNQIKEGISEIEKISSVLIYDIKANADREFYNAKYNNAALKYYRDIEMINQYILYNEYGIDTQDPNYKEINKELLDEKKIKQDIFDIEQYFLTRYNEIWKKLDEKLHSEKKFKKSDILPRKLGLIAGIIFRHILKDHSIDFNLIYKTLQVIEKRNNSIFAHGIMSINKKDCKKLKEINESMIERILIDENVKHKVFSKQDIQKLEKLFIKII